MELSGLAVQLTWPLFRHDGPEAERWLAFGREMIIEERRLETRAAAIYGTLGSDREALGARLEHADTSTLERAVRALRAPREAEVLLEYK